MELKILSMEDEKAIMQVVQDAFAAPPWNDDWKDVSVFHQYITDLVANPNSLALGLYDDETLIGVCLGYIKHWFDGNEYCIEDLCVHSSQQGKGIGSMWIKMVQDYAKAQQFKGLSLRTRRDAPAYYFYQKNGLSESQTDVYFIAEF